MPSMMRHMTIPMKLWERARQGHPVLALYEHSNRERPKGSGAKVMLTVLQIESGRPTAVLYSVPTRHDGLLLAVGTPHYFVQLDSGVVQLGINVSRAVKANGPKS